MSNQDFEELHLLLKQLTTTKQKLAADLAAVKATHKKLIDQTASASDYMCRKLKQLYKNIIDNSNIESNLLSAISITTQTIANHKASKSRAGFLQSTIRPSSIINALDTTLPIWPDRFPGPLCGAIGPASNWIITPGHQVAACVSKKSDPEQRWILGTIVKYNERTQQYVIEDIMEDSSAEAQSAKERHQLPASKVLALPQWACMAGIEGTFYKSGENVLALYPQTTCFYPAIVHQPPTDENPNTYIMHFFDDDYEDGRTRFQEVAVRFIVATKARPPLFPS